MLNLLVQIARNKVHNFDPSGAINLIIESLEGCTKIQALKILTGEYKLIAVEGGADFVEASPDFDIVEWANDCIYGLTSDCKGYLKDLDQIILDIVDADKTASIEVPYNALFNYYFNNDFDELLESIDEGSLAYAISATCKDGRKLLEKLHSFFFALSYLRNEFGLEISAEELILLSSEITNELQGLSHDTSPSVNHTLAKRKYMQSELDKFLEGNKSIEDLRKESVIRPVDITSDTDAGWLSPDGYYYGLKGAVANMLHIQIADLLQATHKIPKEDSLLADTWMSRNGWVKIHHDEVYYDGYFQSKHGYPMIPLTDVQKAKIAQYGKAVYGGSLKFGMQKQECSVSKFQQMDEFAIRKLFDL